MKKLLMVLMAFAMLGCATPTTPGPADTPPRPAAILSCEKPEGEEYVCYSNEECLEYMKGYSAVFQMRTAEPGKFYGLGQNESNPVIHINLFYDHRQWTLIGRIEGEKIEHPTGGMRWYQKVWTIMCNEEGKIIEEGYSEGFRKTNK